MALSASAPTTNPTHSWLRKLALAWVPGRDVTPLTTQTAKKLAACFESHGHLIEDTPSENTDVILTSAPSGQDLAWREALLFMSRRRFGIKGKAPTIYTLVHLTN